MDELVFLENLIRLIGFVGFVFSTTYLIPKGMCFYFEWKERRSFKYLSAAVSLCSVGGLYLLYLLLNTVFRK